MAKFSDKLAKLRKENNLSQEQLADKLNMSRQSISKWESGSSYPDMEKMMEICGVLNCTLDNLLDDGTIKGQKPQNIKFNDIIGDFLKFITNSYNMFWSMKFKEKVLFLLESAFIIVIIIIAFLFLDLIFDNLFSPIFYRTQLLFGKTIYYIFSTIYKMAKIALGITIFIHLFRIRYLDYYITIEDDSVVKKTVEEPIDEIKNIKEDKKGNLIYEKKKEKVIIRDPKHSGHNVMTIITKLFTNILRFSVLFLIIPFIISFIIVLIVTSYSLFLTKFGLIFLTTAIALIGITFLNYLAIELISRFVFNKETNFNRLFTMFIGGLILVGAGIGISIGILSTFEVVDNSDLTNKHIIVETIEYSDDIKIDFINNAEIIYSNDDNVVIEVSCLKYNNCGINKSEYSDFTNIYLTTKVDMLDIYNTFLEEMKNKKILRKDGNIDGYQIKITMSEENYKKILKNN